MNYLIKKINDTKNQIKTFNEQIQDVYNITQDINTNLNLYKINMDNKINNYKKEIKELINESETWDENDIYTEYIEPKTDRNL